jgi:hypothetical protein
VPLDEADAGDDLVPAVARRAPNPARTMHRQSSTATVGSTSSAAPAAATSSTSAAAAAPRPALAKKRSIFSFGSRASDETAPREKLKYKESDAKVLTGMGYSKEQAVWALLQTHSNLPAAIDLLCNS